MNEKWKHAHENVKDFKNQEKNILAKVSEKLLDICNTNYAHMLQSTFIDHKNF